jgi:hypothetical protein
MDEPLRFIGGLRVKAGLTSSVSKMDDHVAGF